MLESEAPLTPLEENAPRGSVLRDSVITYSTDVVDSSVLDSSAFDSSALDDTHTVSSKPRSVHNKETPLYRKKRFWGICLAISVVLLVILLPLFFFVILPEIAQSTINNSQLEMESINITSPNNNSFLLSSVGNISNGGPFDSTIDFNDPVTLYWADKELGTVQFDPINVSGGKASIKMTNKLVTITRVENVIGFSRSLILDSSIKMEFRGVVSVKVKGLSKGGLTLSKEVELVGVNRFGVPKIVEFNITQPDENNLALNVTALMHNPSKFSMSMGTVGISVEYNNSLISNMTIDDFNMTPGDMYLHMYGNALIPKTEADRENFGALMSAFLTNKPVNTTSIVTYSLPDHVHEVGWITETIKGLTLVAELGDSPVGPPQLLTALDFGDIGFKLSAENPFDPIMYSNNSIANYELPFKINITTKEASQNITLYSNGSSFANLITDFFPVTDLHTSLSLNIPPSTLHVTSKDIFINFITAMTLQSELAVNITGHFGIISDTPIGELTLKDLPFTLNSTLQGFSGFKTVTPTVKNVSLYDGTVDHLLIKISAELVNPSNVSLSVGNVSFEISYNNDSSVGVANTFLSLTPGKNDLLLDVSMDPNHNVNAQELLRKFTANETTTALLVGYDGSTNIESLKQAMSLLSIPAPLPGLNFNMIIDTALKIVDVNPTVTSFSDVTMENPFIANIKILSIDSNITSGEFFLGSIKQDRTNNPIILPGNGKVLVSDLPLNLNLDPATMFGLLRRQAQLANLDTSILDALINLGKINVPGVPQNVQIDPEQVKNFDIKEFTEKALANISANITLLSIIQVGEYVMPFPYSQLVTTHTDSSILKLIPILSRPIVQTLIDASILNFDKILIDDPTEDSFTALISGQVTNTGPLPATISFPNGAKLLSVNTVLGVMSLAPIVAENDQAILDNSKSNFKIQDKGAFASVTSDLLLTDSITWTILAENITVTALKIDITGINMQKNVQLKGANGFKDAITINNYTLPSDAPDGGIATVIDSTLNNPSSVGVELGTMLFDVISQNIKIGEVSSSGLTILPSGPTEIKLTGRLIPQTGEGLRVMEQIFEDVINGKSVPVSTKPTGLRPPISWLVSAVTKLTFDTSLPPLKIGKLITSISLNELTMTVTPSTAFAPITSSKEISAQMNIPFGFTLIIEKISENITLVNGNTNMAKLSLLESPAKQTNKSTVITSYQNQPLQVFDNAHDSFESFVKDLTISKSKTIGFSGTASPFIRTPIGQFTLKNLVIDVQSTLTGLNSFSDKPIVVSDIDVTGGTKTVLTIPIKTGMFNPSILTLSTGDVNFDLVVNGNVIGKVLMKDFKIVPGVNNMSATTEVSPKTPEEVNATLTMFTQFIMNQTQQVLIAGSQDSTEIESLKEGLGSLKINTAFPGLNKQLLVSTFITFANDSLKTQQAVGGFTMNNPFTSPLTIESINKAEITFHGIKVGSVMPLSIPITIPGKKVFNSPPVPVSVNLNNKDLVAIIKNAAADAKIDITPLLPLLKLLDPSQPPSKREINTTSTFSSSRDGDLNKLIFEIMQSMKADVNLEIIGKFIDFEMPLNLALPKIPIIYDDSLNLLLQQIATPVAQKLVDQSIITLSTLAISEERADGFKLSMNGEISNAGSIKSTIKFPTGMKILFNDKTLGVAKLSPISSDENGTAVIKSDADFKIADVAFFTQFTELLMISPEISWILSADDVEVDTVGQVLKGIKLSKKVTLKGFNGLKDVKVTSFNITGINPDGFLGIDIDINLGNPSNVGIDLGDAVFNVSTGSLVVGPISATGLTIAPLKTTKIPFKGEITIKDPKVLIPLLTQLASGKAVALAQGVSVKPKGSTGDIPWLSNPFKQLILTVTIPAQQIKNPVTDITIEDLELSFTPDTAFSPSSSSKKIVSTVHLPAQLPIDSVSQSITILDGDNKVASFEIPNTPAVLNGTTLTTSISNIPLKAIDEKAFITFMGQLTAFPSKEFNLSGSVIGSVQGTALPPIAFNVKTSLDGLQGLKSKPVEISNLFIKSADKKGIVISIDVQLTNPSHVQVGAGDVTLDVQFEGESMGSTTLKNLILTPGTKTYPATFLFSPQSKEAGEKAADLLGNLLTKKDSELTIAGTANSTPIKSLAPIFQLLSLKSILHGLPVSVINKITINGNSGTVTCTVVVVNPLNIAIELTGVIAKLSLNGKEKANINLPVAPAKIKVNAFSTLPIPNIPITITDDIQSGTYDIDSGVSVDVNGFIGSIHVVDKVAVEVKDSSKENKLSDDDVKSTKIVIPNPIPSHT